MAESHLTSPKHVIQNEVGPTSNIGTGSNIIEPRNHIVPQC